MSSLESGGESQDVVVGVDVGGTKMFGAVIDNAGTIQDEQYVAQATDQPDESLALLIDLIEHLLESARQRGQTVRGIAVGAPGFVVRPPGTVVWAPALGWRDVPIQAILAKHFGLQVEADNDVNLAALGEWAYGAGRGARDVVCLAVGTGIGAGIIVDGRLCRGANFAAGEIGYLLPGTAFLGQRYDGFGALEQIASGLGVAERGRAALVGLKPEAEIAALTGEDVFAAARGDTAWARAVVAETVDYLAVAIASIGTILNPEVIILSGGVAHAADLLVEPILKRLDGAIPFVPRLVPSELGYRAAVLGASRLLISA